MQRVLVLLAVAACGDDGATSPDAAVVPDAPAGFLVDATIVAAGGASVPATGRLAAAWTVSASSPDYLYKFGDGTSTGAAARMTFAIDPPLAALNAAAFGVALLTVHEPGTAIPDGMVDEAVLEANLRGLGSRHAVIFKLAPRPDIAWLAAFPSGYACARCVPAPPGQTYDTWLPVACSEVVIDVVPDLASLDVCNWT